MRASGRNAGLVLVVAAVAVSGVALVPRVTASREPRESRARPARTAEVVRRDLVQRESLRGALGYGDERSLLAALPGTLTWIASAGTTIRRGESLYGIDARPVRLLYGRVPAYRTLAAGVSAGPDVLQLERNLATMGYDPYGALDIDAEFDAATAAALERWQEELGVDESGALELGSAEFLPGPRRMGSPLVEVGARVGPGTQVAATTSTERQVTMTLDVDSRGLVELGKRVRVQLPEGNRTTGTVASIGNVAEAPPESEGGGDPVVEVIVALAGDEGVGGWDRAPVFVAVESARARDVLAVPVTALVALAEGGFAVETPTVDGSRLLPVRPGDYAGGWVEVRGRAVEEGLEVVIPDGL